jgi:hypothetical protein
MMCWARTLLRLLHTAWLSQAQVLSVGDWDSETVGSDDETVDEEIYVDPPPVRGNRDG